LIRLLERSEDLRRTDLRERERRKRRRRARLRWRWRTTSRV